MAMLTKSLGSTLHLVPGDLSYATPQGLKYPDVTGFAPTQWDSFLSAVGPVSAQSIPWMASVGAHEVEPLGSDGYAGFVTRFAQPYDLSSGSPVAFAYQVGNVAFVHLDGNDLSAQTTINTGYSAGAQTTWLARQLATYRATGSTVDFIVVVENCCCYSTNTNHGSDGGLRDVWGPVFDKYAVDLVISGHLHAYERSNPMINQVATRKVAVGGTVRPVTDGTTYICCGGGGNGLYPSWYGTTDAGDAGSTTAPKVWRWSGGDTATGGTGSSQDVVDPAKGFSANRRALFHCLVVDVVAPTAANSYLTSLQIQTVAPAQSSSAVTDINTTTVIDSVTLSRPSVSTPIDPTCPPD
jgi:hypothetical protein